MPRKGIYAICELDNVSDIVRIPHEKTFIVSEIGSAKSSDGGRGEGEYSDQEQGGKILSYDTRTGSMSTLYDSYSHHDFGARRAIWGSNGCTEPAEFHPLAIDIGRRPSGRWQLLVANRGDGKTTIEMFELIKIPKASPVDIEVKPVPESLNQSSTMKSVGDEWQILWRGCVEFGVLMASYEVHDLVYGKAASLVLSIREANEKNVLWRWSFRDGWQPIFSDIRDDSLWSLAYIAQPERYYISSDYVVANNAVTDAKEKSVSIAASIARAARLNWQGDASDVLLGVSTSASKYLHFLCEKTSFLKSLCDDKAGIYAFDIRSGEQREQFGFRNLPQAITKTLKDVDLTTATVLMVDHHYVVAFHGSDRMLVIPRDDNNE